MFKIWKFYAICKQNSWCNEIQYIYENFHKRMMPMYFNYWIYGSQIHGNLDYEYIFLLDIKGMFSRRQMHYWQGTCNALHDWNLIKTANFFGFLLPSRGLHHFWLIRVHWGRFDVCAQVCHDAEAGKAYIMHWGRQSHSVRSRPLFAIVRQKRRRLD